MEVQVRRKLGSIVNRLEGGTAIASHPDNVLYTAYAYGHETALVLAGLGFSHPIVNILADTDAGSVAEAGVNRIATYPTGSLLLVGASLAFWVVIRVVVNQRRLADKVPLYRACRRELGRIEADLDAALRASTPLTSLSDLQVRAKEVIDRYYAADGWPWPISPPGSDAAVSQHIAELCNRHRDNWDHLPPDTQQREPGHNTVHAQSTDQDA